jgi:DNA repair exonuclease SbcCD ATPase subunit
LVLLAASVLFAQQPGDPLVALQQAAEKKTADWEALAKTLESRVARMLPCDSRVRTSIEDVSHASDARTAALAQYLQAAAAQAHADAQKVAQALATQEGAAHESEVERAEDEQERIAIDAQLADLSESLKRRPQLADAQKSLVAISALIRQRASSAQQQVTQRAALTAALRDLGAAYEARDKAIQAEVAAAGVEEARWKDYYAARIARAQTECAITTAPSRPTQQKKK